MRRIIITALIALTALGGVASADRYRGGGHGHGRRYEQRVYVQPSYRRAYRTPIYRSPVVRVVRRPIYVQRPVIRYRYYNYYQRPAIIVENYPTRPGYLWVAGRWDWNGYEWIWTPGHYQPDSAYDQPYYDQQYYDQQSYDGQYYDQQQPAQYDQSQSSNGYYDSNGIWIQGSFNYNSGY